MKHLPLLSKASTSLLLLTLLACSTKPAETPAVDFCARIHKNDSVSLAGVLAPLADSLKNKTGVYVLEDGGTSLVARAWLSEYAQTSIDVQYFIFSTDNVGLIACDYLVRAADRGVQVRVLVDDIMVEAGVNEILTLDAHPNIAIKIYNPGVNLGKNIYEKVKKFATDFRGANQRMHNKTFTVDGRVAISGGRNMADEYFDFDHEYNFRDRDVLLLGTLVPTIQKSFTEFWNDPLSVPVTALVADASADSAKTRAFEKLHQYACNPDNFWPQVRTRIEKLPLAFSAIQQTGALVWSDSVTFVSDRPGKNTGTHLDDGGVTTDSLVRLVQRARHSVVIQSPYLITTEGSRALFRQAVERGVEIKILTNSLASTDNLEAFSGYQRDRQKLLKTGVRIFEYRPDARERYTIMTGELQKKINFTPIFGLHAKSMVIDGNTVVIGTFNLDPRSSNLNTECFTVIHSSAVARGVLNGMNVEFQPDNAWETTIHHNPDHEAGIKKQLKTMTKRVVPKNIL